MGILETMVSIIEISFVGIEISILVVCVTNPRLVAGFLADTFRILLNVDKKEVTMKNGKARATRQSTRRRRPKPQLRS